MSESLMYSDLSWKDIKQAIEETYIVILPIGSTEQHGPHLPLCTDDYMAQKWAFDAAKLSNENYGTKVLVLPGIHYGNAKHHMGFPGTVTLSFETLKNITFEVSDSVLTHGFRKLVILNVHGGNRYAVRAAAVDLKSKYAKVKPRIFIRVAEDCDNDLNPLIIANKELETYAEEAKIRTMIHGGVLETSKMLYLNSETVKMELAQDIDTSFIEKPKEVFQYDEITPFGARGRPREASVEAGKIMWEALVKSLADYLHCLGKET